MKYNYSILQLVETGSSITESKMFMPWEFVKNKFDINEYEKVYEGDINGYKHVVETLDRLFEIFNAKLPEDFNGHSLSVSDVIELDGKYYYCDTIGWKEINLK